MPIQIKYHTSNGQVYLDKNTAEKVQAQLDEVDKIYRFIKSINQSSGIVKTDITDFLNYFKLSLGEHNLEPRPEYSRQWYKVMHPPITIEKDMVAHERKVLDNLVSQMSALDDRNEDEPINATSEHKLLNGRDIHLRSD